MAKRRKSSSSITYKPKSSTKEYNLVFQKSINKRNYDFSFEKSNDNSDIQTGVDEKILASILARVTALENENKALKAKTKKEVLVSRSEIETIKMLKSNYNKRKGKIHQDSSLERSSSEQESDDARDCESNTIDKDHDNSSVALPILNCLENQANLLIEHYTPVGIQYKNLDKNIRAGIIRKFKKANPHFSNCIRENARRWDKKSPVNGEKRERMNQSTVKGEKYGRTNQLIVNDEKCGRSNQLIINDEKCGRSNQLIVNDEKRERKCAQKKITFTNHYSESYKDSYDNVDDELDKISKDHTHYSLSNPIPIYYHNKLRKSESEDHNLSLPDSDDKESKPLKKICISDFDKLTSQRTTGSCKAKSSKRSLKQTLVS
ncbi:1943_t:CDS:2, partial [Funneliformis caledonium]